jgi:hypothetical protein
MFSVLGFSLPYIAGICKLKKSSSSSYIATDSQLVSLSWYHAPFGTGYKMLHFFE